MSKVVEVKFGNGQIVYNSRIDPEPPTSEQKDNVTITNSGRPGAPAHFEVTFMLKVNLEQDGVKFNNVFHWKDVVLEENHNASYREVEDKAARTLAPALRAAADLIEQEIARFDNTQEVKQGTDS